MSDYPVPTDLSDMAEVRLRHPDVTTWTDEDYSVLYRAAVDQLSAAQEARARLDREQRTLDEMWAEVMARGQRAVLEGDQGDAQGYAERAAPLVVRREFMNAALDEAIKRERKLMHKVSELAGYQGVRAGREERAHRLAEAQHQQQVAQRAEAERIFEQRPDLREAQARVELARQADARAKIERAQRQAAREADAEEIHETARSWADRLLSGKR